MADRHLRRLFARAGQRFTDSHEFHLDRARWDGAGIAFFPNSRFGIGVLSYFMLAEEVDLMSVRYAEPGLSKADPIAASILGTGTLFRLRRTYERGRLIDSCGTSVRLYLRTKSDPSELAASIQSWLGVPEFDVALMMPDEVASKFLARQTTNRLRRINQIDSDRVCDVLEVPGSEGRYSGPRVFLRPTVNDRYDNGLCMVDGIITRAEFLERSDRWLFRFHMTGGTRDTIPSIVVVNFTEDVRVDLSANRGTMRVGRGGVDFVWDHLFRNAWRALAEWPTPKFIEVHECVRTLGLALDNLSTGLRAGAVSWSSLAISDDQEAPGFPTGAGLCDLDPFLLVDLELAELETAGERRQATSQRGWYPGGPRSLLAFAFKENDWHREPTTRTDRVTSNLLFVRLAELGLIEFGPAVRVLAYLPPLNPASAVCPLLCAKILFTIGSTINLTDLPDLSRFLGVPLPQLQGLLTSLAAFGADGTAMGPLPVEIDGLTDAHFELLMRYGDEPERLNWADIFGFAARSKRSLESVIALARELVRFGVSAPDLDAPPEIPDVERLNKALELVHPRLLSSGLRIDDGWVDFIAKHRSIDRTLVLEALWVLEPLGIHFGPGEADEPTPKEIQVDVDRLPAEQRALINTIFQSGRLDPRMLDWQRILLLVARNGLPLESILSVARSLVASGYELPCTQDLDPGEIETLDRFAANAWPFSERLFAGLGQIDGPSAWDFALAAAALRQPVTQLTGVVSCLEKLGLNVVQCRNFIDLQGQAR